MKQETRQDVEDPELGTDTRRSSRSLMGKPERQTSLMREVHDRIESLQEVSPFTRSFKDHPHSQSEKLSQRTRAALTAQSLGADAFDEEKQKGANIGTLSSCRISFGAALVLAMVLVTLLSCSSMFIPLEIYRQQLQANLRARAHSDNKALQGIVTSLLDTDAIDQVSLAMSTVRNLTQERLSGFLSSVVDDIWTYMAEQHQADASWNGTGPGDQLRAVAQHIEDLAQQPRLVTSPHDVWLNVSFETGQQISVFRQAEAWNASQQVTNASISLTVTLNDPQLSDLPLFLPVDNGTDRVCRGRDASDNNPAYWVLAEENLVNSRADCEAQCVLTDACKGIEYVNISHRCEVWIRAQGIGASRAFAYHSCYRLSSRGPPGYALQKVNVEGYPGAVLRNMLSQVWVAASRPRITNSFPIAYCGNYSCFNGVVSTTATLSDTSELCRLQWKALAENLTGQNRAELDTNTSTMFVIISRSRFRAQHGLLIGSAHHTPTSLTLATDSQQSLINATSFALKERYGHWDSYELQRSRSFSFGLREASQAREPSFTSCDSELALRHGDTNCMRVGTVTVDLDSATQWLVVIVLPVVAYSISHTAKMKLAQDAATQKIQDSLEVQLRELGATFHQFIVMNVCVAFVSVCLALGLGCLMSAPLRQLDKDMQQLANFKSTRRSPGKWTWRERVRRRSNIVEVSNLQYTFNHLSLGIEAFTRFVPETVVRKIVSGEPRAARLHVKRREVTIMFSDIRDFTSISEVLSEKDLLFVLTRYLSVMTRLIEDFGGVVAEVLGDGLLAFWNTPDDVEDHAAKACDAALAQQQAMSFLNGEFANLNLPTLAVRIGLHTGSVLSGNLGSEMKMKFGCLGDPINLASRLEGLCKFYGVGIVCSSDTHDMLPPGYIFCRKLDLVKVKGRREPTLIYEVVAHDDKAEGNVSGQLASQSRPASLEYAIEALRRSAESLCKSASLLCLDDGLPSAHQPQNPSTLLEKGRGACLGSGEAAVAATDAVSTEVRLQVQLYERALEAWQQANFSSACLMAQELLRTSPDDLAASRLLERSSPYVRGQEARSVSLSEAELAAWTGVFVMTDK
eukprot:TRINITY_DN32230_c0_g1_i1.p1 TRINITY_DN32230_c0_g1~~TRINITY_DN32230_c0_g1_i1.p1  ORF type:complete len:1082 (+),score=186.33 TRINITY_DN32230_c0_g1_i1:42-3287(+)